MIAPISKRKMVLYSLQAAGLPIVLCEGIVDILSAKGFRALDPPHIKKRVSRNFEPVEDIENNLWEAIELPTCRLQMEEHYERYFYMRLAIHEFRNRNA